MRHSKNRAKLEEVEEEFQKASIGGQSLTVKEDIPPEKIEAEENFMKFMNTVDHAKKDKIKKEKEIDEMLESQPTPERSPLPNKKVEEVNDEVIVKFC